MKKTKALLFTTGEAQRTQLLETEIIKETFSEHDFEKEETTIENGDLGYSTTQNTIKVGEVNVFALFFADGSIYEVGKGFRNTSSHPLESTKKWVKGIVKDLTPVVAKPTKKVEVSSEDKKD